MREKRKENKKERRRTRNSQKGYEGTKTAKEHNHERKRKKPFDGIPDEAEEGEGEGQEAKQVREATARKRRGTYDELDNETVSLYWIEERGKRMR